MAGSTITNQEFRSVLEEMVGEPCPDEDWKEFIQKVDYDNSGTLEFQEFLYALYLWFADEDFDDEDEKDEVDSAFELLKNHFRQIDNDKDDMITIEEFRKILNSVSPKHKVTEDRMKRILSGIEGFELHKNISFKQYLSGMYLFVTGDV